MNQSGQSRGVAQSSATTFHSRAVPIFILAGLLLRLPFGDGELIIESDVDHVQVEVKQQDKVVNVIDTDTGTRIRLKPGQYDIALRDTQQDQLTVSNNSVILKRGSKTIVKITQLVQNQSTTPSVSESQATSKPATEEANRGASRQLETVPKMPVNLSLYLKPHRLNEHGLVTLANQHWTVSSAYRGIAADGDKVVDMRPTLFISNADDTFSSAIVRLSQASAAKLTEELVKQLAVPTARVEMKDSMTVTLATQPYKLNENQVVHLAEEHLTCEVLPSYKFIDGNQQSGSEQRITIVVQDAQNSFLPLIVRMNDQVVRKLIDDLQTALKAPSASVGETPPEAKSFVGIYRDAQGRKLEVALDGPELTYAIHWGPNGPISSGHVVQTSSGELQFQQPGETTPITIKRSESDKSVTTISLLKLDFVRQ